MVEKKDLAMILLLLSLSACSSGEGWSWRHRQGLDAGQLERDLFDCRYYASITDSHAFGAERPVPVQDWDEGVRECMAQRGWIFIEGRGRKD